MDRKELGNLCRDKRKSMGLSQTQLAKKAGISFPRISDLETGANNIQYAHLINILHALGLDISIVTKI